MFIQVPHDSVYYAGITSLPQEEIFGLMSTGPSDSLLEDEVPVLERAVTIY